MTEEILKKATAIKSKITDVEKRMKNCTDYTLTISSDEPYYDYLVTAIRALRERHIQELNWELQRL